MRLKKFYEYESIEISPERVNKIIEELKEIASNMEEKSKYTEKLLNELNNYKSPSKTSNDQIDDSILSLYVIKKNISDSIDKVDNIVNNLTNYIDEGRNFLYSEN
ncbi:MAG: hypothetical protein M0R46_06765 [Candidatus Muirbacterium halophilum]|nr:hypothetical protein [Candidatus Muirbacterium halophilum]